MKRFFQAAPKDGSFKKLCTPSDSNTAAENGVSGSQPSENAQDESDRANEDPTSFMAWNANSFLLRLKNDREAFCDLVREKDPDVIAIQEVRMPAAGAKGEPKRRGSIKDDTKDSREDKQVITRAFSSPPLSNYSVFWSLSDNKYGGTALLVKKRFTPTVTYSLESGKVQRGKEHDSDGRVILAEFPSLRVLNTYVPNNGWKDDALGFQRRRKWDERMLEFVSTPSDKPLVWCGDLNVSHTDLDVSHPDFFRNAKQPGYIPPDPQDCGQPGFTPNEQKRFSQILQRGDLVDAYRYLHAVKDEKAGFSWSGHPIGKYRGKRMRIDYFLISKSLVSQLRSCDMHGRGVELVGFVGSDHCPITMTLFKPTDQSEFQNVREDEPSEEVSP